MNRCEKIEELNERTIKILELTKKEMDKYALERKNLFQFSCKEINSSIELKQWENELEKIEGRLYTKE